MIKKVILTSIKNITGNVINDEKLISNYSLDKEKILSKN